MFTEQFFDLLLEIGDGWKVKAVETNIERNEIDICVEYEGEGDIYDYAPVRRWRHLDTMQFKTYINCRLPRMRTEDGKVKTESPPWGDRYERHTHLFESVVIELLLATKNQTQTAKLARCKFDVVNRVMHNAVSRGMERRKDAKEVFRHLSIDEKSFQKGHSYVTVLSHPESGRVLDVVEERTIEACQTLINSTFTLKQRETVKTVGMDMWQAFMTAAGRALPRAEIVHDKFHLIKYLSDAIDKVRRREVKKNAGLKHSRFAMLKNEENLTARQRIKFDAIREANYEVSRAWEARENFRQVFKNSSLEESETIFWQWHQTVKNSGIKEVIKVAEMFANHLKGVLNAMTTSFSNAMAERLNGKIQLLKSIARGYRKFDNFRSAILFFFGNLNLFPLKCR